ncbi:MAG: HAMP domain-containing protein [Undibacterium sp.]|nr:HAMP domain-containing protein [Undibacterium sp.]
MNRLFLRFLPPVLLSIALASVLVYVLGAWWFGDPVEQNAARQAAPQLFLLENYVDQAPSDEWLSRLNRIREVSPVKMELISLNSALASLNEVQQQALQKGKVVMDVPHKAFYRRVDLIGSRYVGSETDVLYAYDLPIDAWLNMKMELLRYFIVALILLVPIAFWSRSHWREVAALMQVAEQFGQGQLSVRAEVKAKTSMAPLAQQINQMATHIEQLIGAQKMLLHAVSHELRTPIARLAFGLELLHGDLSNAANLNRRIAGMSLDVEELNSLVNELLTMAKLEQQMSPSTAEKVCLNSEHFVAACLDKLTLQHPNKAVQVNIDVAALAFFADEKLLKRAFENLLKNALKYAEEVIFICVSRPLENEIHIAVEDDGSGIPEEQREKIFDAFYRLDRSRDKATGGFGLGLAIVKQAMILQQGRVLVEQSDLGGARFVLVLEQAI